MGERKLAGSAAVKAIAAARHETINTMVESSNEAMRVQTPGEIGRAHV